MRDPEAKQILELLRRLEQLERQTVAPQEQAVRLIAQQAIMEEISRLASQDWLAVYRNGSSLDAIPLI